MKDDEETGLEEPEEAGTATDEERSRELDETFRLIQRYQQGDEGALNTLFAKYYDQLRRIVWLEMSAFLRSKVDPDDIANSAMAKAFEKIDQFEYREPASVLNWLKKIARNKILDRAKKFGGKPEIELDALMGPTDSSTGGFDPARSETSPPSRVARDEQHELLDDCLSELKEDYREVIVLRVFEGGSWEHVAREMGRSKGAARELFTRAKLALMKVMKRRRAE